MEWRVGSVVGGCGREGRGGAGFMGTFINTGLIYRHPASPRQLREWRQIGGGGVTDICFHAYAYTIKRERPLADRYWSGRQWQRWAGPPNWLCPNLRICSSSCLHNEVKWSKQMLGWPRPKHSTPDAPLTDSLWAGAISGTLKCQIETMWVAIYDSLALYKQFSYCICRKCQEIQLYIYNNMPLDIRSVAPLACSYSLFRMPGSCSDLRGLIVFTWVWLNKIWW